MALILSRQHVLLAAVTGFISWGLLINWLPAARYVGHAFVAGAVASVFALASVLLLTVRAKPTDAALNRTSGAAAGVAFLSPSKWNAEVESYRKSTEYEPEPLYPQSFVVSEAIGEIITLAARDFISSWYDNISKRPVFVQEVDRALRTALGNLRDRIQNEDIVSLVVSRITPILTAHLREFDRAERAVRGRNLTRSVTESTELDLAIASKYRDGRLHPAVSVVGFTDQKSLLQDHLRKLVMGLLPQLLPDGVLNSRVVSILVREIVACAVLLPLVTLLADPDTWNQLMETYGRSVWQDRKTVRKLRAALDEHASPNAKSKHAQEFPRLAPNDSERAFERFVRAIRRCNNLSDARRFRAQVASQLKRASMVEGQDQVYLRRLETGKRVLDQKVAKLSATETGPRSAAPARPGVQRDAISNLQDASLVDVMHNVAGLSYFMEFMDRQQKMSLVQFWIVVDGFRNPLEDDFGDDSQSSITWTEADVNDMALINETYFHKPELNVPEESRRAVKAFLSAGKKATPEQYRKARTAILTTQSAVLEEMETKYYPKFKESDLWYKYLSSDEAASTGAPPQPPPRHNTPAPEPTERRPLPPLMTRASSQPNVRPKDLRRAAVSGEVRSSGKLFDDTEPSPRQSFDSERSAPLFDDDYDTDPLGLSTHSLGGGSQNGEVEARNNSELIEAMGAALNDIMTNQPSNGRSDDHRSGVVSPNSVHSEEHKGRQETRPEKPKPSIASLGLVDPNARTSVFDDELFPDEKKFIEDEYADPENEEKDPADEIHEAAPGDLGLAEAIAALTEDIDKLVAQESVLDALTRKAELTNNTAELRILGKSKASIQREIRRKEMQRQQYIIQESDSSLYGRSTVQIKSIMVDKEEDGREFAIYVIEVRRQAGEQMPAATWAVARRYSEFHELHQKLRARYPSVRQLEFPRRRVMMKLQKDFLQKRRAGLETYLRQLLQLPEVCRSREFRSFLSQQSILPHAEPLSSSESDSRDLVTRIYNSVADGMEDFLGNLSMLDQLSAAGQSLISAATTNSTSSTLNPSTTTPASSSALNSNDLTAEDAVTAAEAEAELNAFVGEDRELEPFVKPICDLFLETFELNRGNNWLRGRAVVVVLHQLLGGTIERKVRDVARSLSTPDSLLRYVSLVRDTLWPAPERVLRPPPPRTASQRARSRNEASFMFAALIPDVVGSVVGRANAQQAARRVFALVNNEKLNLHLVLSVLDEIVLALFGR